MHKAQPPFHILFIDDNPADLDLFVETFAEGKVLCKLDTASSGQKALNMLRGENGETHIQPDLILLDLNMPQMSGHEVLAEIKGDDVLKSIPVVMMTSSAAERDIAKSYALNANSYIIKPIDLNQLSEVVNRIENFFFTIAKLPPRRL
jgi:CheY-like chemotaxis protein